jgi:hypothetical protein
MKRLSIASAALICAGAAAGAQQTPQLAPPGKVIVTAPVEVPMAVVSGVPIVETTINGKGPFKFGIETGAGFSVITPAAAKALNLTSIAESADGPQYRLDRVAIGAATFENVEVASMEFAQGGIDGVFGLPFYGELLITLDYPARRLRLERGALPPANGADVLSIAHVGPFWGLPITVAGKPFTAVLDTRSTGGFGFTPDTAKSVTFDGGLKVVGRARGAAIAETDVQAGRIAGDIAIGRYRFPSPEASVRALPPGFPDEPIVGARVLNNFVVTLDQRNRRLRLSRDGSNVIDAGRLCGRIRGPRHQRREWRPRAEPRRPRRSQAGRLGTRRLHDRRHS